MPKTRKKIIITTLILLAIGYLQVDTVLVGENFIWTAFFILLGLGLMFRHIEELEEEVERLRARRDKNN